MLRADEDGQMLSLHNKIFVTYFQMQMEKRNRTFVDKNF